MYVFEVLADCHLTPEQLTAYKDSFIGVFTNSLSDRDAAIKVAALKAITAFFTSIDDSSVVIGYIEIIPLLLNTVVDALKTNEEQGKRALESMIELTNTHPEIWKNNTNLLINVMSQIITQTTFEDLTRSSATEVILTLSQQMPASLRKAEETKTMLFPALIQLMTEVPEDLNEWVISNEEKITGQTDPFNTAINGINTLSANLQEKTVLAAVTPLI